MNMHHSLITALAMLAASAIATPAAQWHYAFGVHDMNVPEAHSDTFGVNGTLIVEDTYDSGVHLYGEGELFVDRDQDELDPDHIPVWWRTHLYADGRLWEIAPSFTLGWIGEINTKANTVSCIEREMKVFPGLTASYHAGPFDASLKVATGMFFLEIDDDVPKERGYTRDDFRNSTLAVSYAGSASIELGESCKLHGQAQTWRNDTGWLENQYIIDLRYDIGRWMKDSVVVLGFEVNEYNLSVYQPSEGETTTLPILPWDHDQFLKLSLETLW